MIWSVSLSGSVKKAVSMAEHEMPWTRDTARMQNGSPTHIVCMTDGELFHPLIAIVVV